MREARQFTDADLESMRDQHLPYELIMLRAAAEVLAEPKPDDHDAPAIVRRWMAIECFYVHLRSLDEFFYGGGSKERDASAIHFFPDSSKWWSRDARPTRSKRMAEAVRLAGTMVAHMSYDRQPNLDAGKGLFWRDLVEEMDGVYIAFQRALNQTQYRVPLHHDFSLVPNVAGLMSDDVPTETTISTPADSGGYFFDLWAQRRKK